ncbi:hypothetical protein ACVWU4_000969 [Campylobacter coli]
MTNLKFNNTRMTTLKPSDDLNSDVEITLPNTSGMLVTEEEMYTAIDNGTENLDTVKPEEYPNILPKHLEYIDKKKKSIRIKTGKILKIYVGPSEHNDFNTIEEAIEYLAVNNLINPYYGGTGDETKYLYILLENNYEITKQVSFESTPIAISIEPQDYSEGNNNLIINNTTGYVFYISRESNVRITNFNIKQKEEHIIKTHIFYNTNGGLLRLHYCTITVERKLSNLRLSILYTGYLSNSYTGSCVINYNINGADHTASLLLVLTTYTGRLYISTITFNINADHIALPLLYTDQGGIYAVTTMNVNFKTNAKILGVHNTITYSMKASVTSIEKLNIDMGNFTFNNVIYAATAYQGHVALVYVRFKNVSSNIGFNAKLNGIVDCYGFETPTGTDSYINHGIAPGTHVMTGEKSGVIYIYRKLNS